MTVGGLSVEQLILLIVIDILIVVAISVVAGATAPRWPDSRLDQDTFLLRSLPWETSGYFRALRVRVFAQYLPELGSAFGGVSKRELGGSGTPAYQRYLMEVRRAEYVHWISVFSWVPLVLFNPWWLVLIFAVLLSVGNAPFLLILRHNHQRLVRIIATTSRNRDA
ncbi:MAG: hypothetical protein RJB01_1041 [Actinomycetota bacterium]